MYSSFTSVAVMKYFDKKQLQGKKLIVLQYYITMGGQVRHLRQPVTYTVKSRKMDACMLACAEPSEH